MKPRVQFEGGHDVTTATMCYLVVNFLVNLITKLLCFVSF